MSGRYGESFVDLGEYVGHDWQEFMHYLYLPVRLPTSETGLSIGTELLLPERLAFLWDAIQGAWYDSGHLDGYEHLRDPYIYVTARRGFATPGNPLNRPGWHCDDFGGTDLNYIWTDVYPTQFLISKDPLEIEDDDQASMNTMERYANLARYPLGLDMPMHLKEGPANHLLRLTPWVIHNTPEIPRPGGMRSFFKISVSSHRYNLLGNSHNYLLNYDWEMHDRQAVRNQPGGNSDYVK